MIFLFSKMRQLNAKSALNNLLAKAFILTSLKSSFWQGRLMVESYFVKFSILPNVFGQN
jgi:hypothetical protein